jgi:hypothetical protein
MKREKVKKLQLLRVLVPVLAMFALITPVSAQKGAVPKGSKIFIAPMAGDLNPFIAAEIIKKKLPVTVVIDEKDADYILTGASIKGDDKWYHTVFSGKDKNEGSVQLLDVKAKTLIWAAEAGDRSLMFSSFRRGGQRKVADRIVDKMKDDLFKK